MKLKAKAGFLSLLSIMLLTACNGNGTSDPNSDGSSSTSISEAGTPSTSAPTSQTSSLAQTFVDLKIEIPDGLTLTDGDLFNPKALTIKLIDNFGAETVADPSYTVIKVDDVTYKGTPIEVHAPSVTITVTYKKEGQNELSNRVTLDVNEKGMPKKVKVIVMAGQSNMVGHSLVDRMKETMSDETIARYKVGFNNVLIYNSCNPFSKDTTKINQTNDFVPVRTGMGRIPDDTTKWSSGCFGPELGLAEYLNSTYPDETFYIIKDATGGTGISDRWYSPSSFDLLGKDKLEDNSLYAHLLTRVDEGMKLLEKKDLDPEIISFLWMQGEQDAKEYADKYGTLWGNLVKDLTDEWNKKDYITENGLSTIDGGISEYWSNYQFVNAAKEIYANEHSKSHFVDIARAGLTRNPNDLAHLDAPSMIKLGKLFGEKLTLAINDLDNPAVNTPITIDGAGAETNPYLINSYADWLLLSYKSFIDHATYSNKYIKITNDIGSAVQPVHTMLGIANNKLFSGKIDGDGHTIYVDLLNRQYKNTIQAMGLIAYSGGAEMKNLTIDGKVTLKTEQTAETKTSSYAGAFVGLAQWASGKATKITNCVNKANVTVNEASNGGGFVGRTLGNLEVTGSENQGNVTIDGNYAGGIVGYVGKSSTGSAPSLTITDTTNKGNVTGFNGVGGIVGIFVKEAAGGTHRLTKVSNAGTISGTDQVGGIVGYITDKATSGFDIAITYYEAGHTDDEGLDVVVGVDGNKKETSIEKIDESI